MTGMGFRTDQIHAGVVPDPVTGAIITPIYQSTTFVQDSVDEYMAKGFSYTRAGNPTVAAFQRRMAALEGGTAATAYGSGMAATVAVMMALFRRLDPRLRASITFDNDTAFARHGLLASACAMMSPST